MKTLIIKSLLTSLYQREGIYPSLAKRGEGRFFNNDALLMNSFVTWVTRYCVLYASSKYYPPTHPVLLKLPLLGNLL
jgi:hypothetical protein